MTASKNRLGTAARVFGYFHNASDEGRRGNSTVSGFSACFRKFNALSQSPLLGGPLTFLIGLPALAQADRAHVV